jgi:hypothetical protein
MVTSVALFPRILLFTILHLTELLNQNVNVQVLMKQKKKNCKVMILDEKIKFLGKLRGGMG